MAMARSRKERGEFSKVQIFGQHHSNRRILQLPDPVLDTKIEHLGTKLVRSIGTRVRNEKNLQSKIYQSIMSRVSSPMARAACHSICGRPV